MAAVARSLVCGAPALCRSACAAGQPSCSAAASLMVSNCRRGAFPGMNEFVGLRVVSAQRRDNSSAGRKFDVRSAAKIQATIQVGDKLPEAELLYLDKENNVQTVKISELTKGKKVVLFAVPGAFTPTCSQKHVPGFVEKADELRAKGVDAIACVSVNDVFVLKAWGEGLGTGDKVLLLSDGNVHFTRAMGVELDLSDKPAGLGIRSRRYALLAEDGIVTQLNLEEGGAFSVSGAEEILKAL